MNFVDFILLAAILAVAGFVIYRIVRRRKKGGGGCESCGSCSGCPMAGNCNKEEKK